MKLRRLALLVLPLLSGCLIPHYVSDVSTIRGNLRSNDRVSPATIVRRVSGPDYVRLDACGSDAAQESVTSTEGDFELEGRDSFSMVFLSIPAESRSCDNLCFIRNDGTSVSWQLCRMHGQAGPAGLHLECDLERDPICVRSIHRPRED